MTRPLCGTREGLAWHYMHHEDVCIECAAGSERRARLARLEGERFTPTQTEHPDVTVDRALGQLVHLLAQLTDTPKGNTA